MSTEHQPNTTAAVYSLRFFRLLELLRDERAAEPRLTTRNHAEWLAWGHGARWLVRMLFDSRARAVAHGDASLPSVCSQSDIQALVEYLDKVFATLPSEHSPLGAPFPAIAWSVNQVAAEQSDSDAGRPLPSVCYLDRLLQLSTLRSSAEGWDSLVRRMQVLVQGQRDATNSARVEGIEIRDRLAAMELQLSAIGRRLRSGSPEGSETQAEGSVELF
ncbi:hypothetical protein FOMPIDRAFT_1055674 [Fomitopsis schrenkii]|uniref:Uncharacterized protein n=1 Tax=Fomitopsis schrenkii TaxID=2126942 RepID=S8F498_FOMSC|nr:hypothetical protein FOMPIDRAFT_1055674 [Fomitopsis schrenkii]